VPTRRLQWTAGFAARSKLGALGPQPLNRAVGRHMYTPTCNSSVCRCYWRLVKRWPAVHLVICCFGVAVGIGGLFAFGDTPGNQRQVLASRIVGLLMLMGYGWILISLITKTFRGSWDRHCEARVVQCGGQPDGAATGSQPIRSETNSTSPAAVSRR
jgi:hypothetical protein